MNLETYKELLSEVETILNMYLTDNTAEVFEEIPEIDNALGLVRTYTETLDGEHSLVDNYPLKMAKVMVRNYLKDAEPTAEEGYSIEDLCRAEGIIMVLSRVEFFTDADLQNIKEALEEYTQEALKGEDASCLSGYTGGEPWVNDARDVYEKIEAMLK